MDLQVCKLNLGVSGFAIRLHLQIVCGFVLLMHENFLRRQWDSKSAGLANMNSIPSSCTKRLSVGRALMGLIATSRCYSGIGTP